MRAFDRSDELKYCFKGVFDLTGAAILAHPKASGIQ